MPRDPHLRTRWIVARSQLVTGVLLALAAFPCAAQTPAEDAAGPVAAQIQKDLTPAQVAAAIDRAAAYLTRACDADGRFTYRVDLDPSVRPESRYNVLRHAGAIYALAQYHERSHNDDAKHVLLRAGSFLKRYIQPVADNRHMLAVWSLPELNLTATPRQAKLGGSGLGLIALLSLERVEPGFTTVEDLRCLGRFILYMQKVDGSFYSKFYPDEGGRNDQWSSMYYPGEAALGLLMLYERDPQPQWLGGAVKALGHLARTGRQQPETLPDQWFLLAAERLLRSDEAKSSQVSQHDVLEHVRRTCRDMLDDQRGQDDDPVIGGCYTNDGRTCPTATRLEGLLAALRFLPDGDESLSRQIRRSVDSGVAFLVNSQVPDGPHAGGLPRVKPGFPGSHRSDTPIDAWPTEIRIDYVQHALSALLAYEQQLSVRAGR